jgi:ribosomal protein S20
VATSASKTAVQQQQQQVQQQQTPSPAATATESIEDRLRTLDKLAAEGYITKQEYEARKKSILDSL